MAYQQNGPYMPQQPPQPTHYYDYEESVQQRPPPQGPPPPQGQQRLMNQRPPPVRNYGSPPPSHGGRGGYGGPGPRQGHGGPPQNLPRHAQPYQDDRMHHIQNGQHRQGRPALGLEEGMTNMTINDGRNYGGPMQQQQQQQQQQRQRPPPNGRPPPSNGLPDDMYGQMGRPPPQRPPPQNGPRGPPQRMASHGNFNSLRNGHQQNPPPQAFQRQGPPPPVRNYGGPQNEAWAGEQFSNYEDEPQQYGNGRMPLAQERFQPPGGPIQRSMTMPARGHDFIPPHPPAPYQRQQSVPPQHGFNGSRGYGQQPPPMMEHNIPPAGYEHRGGHGMPGALRPEQYESHVNEVLDSYYDGGQQYDGPTEPIYEGPRCEPTGITPPGLQRNQIEGFDPSWEKPQPNSNSAFAAHAHRSRSQPDLRDSGFSVGSQTALAEMPGDIPPVPSAMAFPAQADLPQILRVKTPAPESGHMPSRSPPDPMPQQFSPPRQPPPPNAHISQSDITHFPQPPNEQQYPTQQYPSQIQSQNSIQQQYPSYDAPQQQYHSRVQSGDTLPYHPLPQNYNNRDSGADALPEHPAPVRPGLIQDQHLHMGQVPPGPPPPVRQYAPRDSIESRSSQAPPSKGPITREELVKTIQLAKSAPNDQSLQLTLAKKYIEAADVLADEGGRADSRTTKKNRESYILDAHKLLKKLANGSHPYPEAMFFLAQCHGDGALGLQVDRDRAFSLYHSAAKLNHPPSAYRTAVCCEIGAGTKKDPVKSVQWYRKAASLGDTGAMYKLGIILLKGLLGQQKSTRDALSWLKRAADQADANNPHALHELALLYERADGRDQSIIPDTNYARELFTQAAELGYSPSQFRLGYAYEFGTMGCPIDPRKSIAWYSRAALKGEPDSELALSGWYLTGSEGVLEQSDTEAYLWARRAAEKGLPKAEYAVGHLTEAGFGVPPNLEEAKRWYYKAASQGFAKAQERLKDLKKGGTAGQQKQRERLTRSNVKKDDDCVIM